MKLDIDVQKEYSLQEVEKVGKKLKIDSLMNYQLFYYRSNKEIGLKIYNKALPWSTRKKYYVLGQDLLEYINKYNGKQD